jgi:hypothetical protein
MRRRKSLPGADVRKGALRIFTCRRESANLHPIKQRREVSKRGKEEGEEKKCEEKQ